MKNRVVIMVAFTFLWIGFVGAISFMEAWLKFRAPNVTIPIGLGIGKLVFRALNKVEWFCCVILLINFILMKKKQWAKSSLLVWLATSCFILLLQTWVLLPILENRADVYLKGEFVSPSNVHFFYVALEVVKVTVLLMFGTIFLKEQLH